MLQTSSHSTAPSGQLIEAPPQHSAVRRPPSLARPLLLATLMLLSALLLLVALLWFQGRLLS